jgi:hypothetical protein
MSPKLDLTGIPEIRDTVVLGSYDKLAKDVYFSLEGDLVKQVNRMLWSSLGFLPPPAPQNQTSGWIQHRKTAKELRQAVADARPEGNDRFRPDPQEISFTEQLGYLARAPAGACRRVSDTKSPFTQPEAVNKHLKIGLKRWIS